MDKKSVEVLEKILREIQDIRIMVQESICEKEEKIEERILREVQDIRVIVEENLND